MGALYRTDDTGLHVSTGKLDPSDWSHEPVWGDWTHEDMGAWVRYCEAVENCDVPEYRMGPPS